MSRLACFALLVAGLSIARAETTPLAVGRNGAVVGTTGEAAVRAGLATLKAGGSAVDAAMATALAQVVECGGAYVSFAGHLSMTYYDAGSGKLSYLNACFNTALEEKDPLSIPKTGVPSGRSALVPGFMAGVQAALDRFGKLPRAAVFAPAIALAENGFEVPAMLGGMIHYRQPVLQRLPGTKKIFTKPDGSFYVRGDLFRQPEVAATLHQVSEKGAAFMYSGAWADHFVAAVQAEGGHIGRKDMESYQVIWEEPTHTRYREYDVFAPGLSSLGGVSILSALNLLERVDLRQTGHFTTSAKSLFRLMQICFAGVLSYLPPKTLAAFKGADLSPVGRLSKETADWSWKQMQAGKWPFGAHMDTHPLHSDGVVVVDRWGNVAALTHSINTNTWGTTGLVVDGVSIPDSAAFQQAAIERAGPGHRLPDPMCPLIVLRDGKPVLGSSAIGGGLHEKTVQVLESILGFAMDAQSAVEGPAPLLPEFGAAGPVARVEAGAFDRKVLDAVTALGQVVKEVPRVDAGLWRGYWVGVQIVPGTGERRAAGTRELPSRGGGY